MKEDEIIEEIRNLDLSIGIIWKGKVKTLFEVIEFLETRGAYIVYKKTNRGKIRIEVEKEEDNYANTRTTTE